MVHSGYSYRGVGGDPQGTDLRAGLPGRMIGIQRVLWEGLCRVLTPGLVDSSKVSPQVTSADAVHDLLQLVGCRCGLHSIEHQTCGMHALQVVTTWVRRHLEAT